MAMIDTNTCRLHSHDCTIGFGSTQLDMLLNAIHKQQASSPGIVYLVFETCTSTFCTFRFLPLEQHWPNVISSNHLRHVFLSHTVECSVGFMTSNIYSSQFNFSPLAIVKYPLYVTVIHTAQNTHPCIINDDIHNVHNGLHSGPCLDHVTTRAL